ncbi:hypothetical protein [Virgibacillus byunsanensis]|uniref:hypothetical protein n=1 Tax=Virgibacillus byunsanensis TaxID=570945 RepID=UPI0036F1CE82
MSPYVNFPLRVSLNLVATIPYYRIDVTQLVTHFDLFEASYYAAASEEVLPFNRKVDSHSDLFY